MSPHPWLVYSDGYRADYGPHVFPVDKYGRLHDRLIRDGVASPEEFVSPEPADDRDFLLVHTQEYLSRLERLASSPEGMLNGETPVSRDILDFARIATGGTILAARTALDTRVAVNLSGGFHHAFPDHEEGFCHFNDVAVAIRRLRADGLARRFLVIDLDLHQGNGTAVIFSQDADVFTFSMHEENTYPPKERSSLDVGLPSFCSGEFYLERLTRSLARVAETVPYDLAFYNAGADPYRHDKLGTLRLSKDDIAERDRVVIEFCRTHSLPVAVVLGGGYAEDTEDVVDIHMRMIETARDRMF